MRAVAVIGLSTFGTALVRALADERCRILAVDRDRGKIDLVRDFVEEAVIADARDRRALEALRLKDFDAVVLSLGEPIDGSLLAVLHLRELEVHNVIARAVTEDHRKLLQQIGVMEVVFPEFDMAERTARTLSRPGFVDTMRLGEGISVVEVAPTRTVIGHTLGELKLRQEYGITVIAVRDTLRDELRVNPDPGSKITESDALVVLGKDEDIDRFVKK